MGAPFIKFADIHKSFNGNRVLQGVDLSIFKGEVTAVIGKSGTGKSVLLKHIIGLIHSDRGELLINGESLDLMTRGKKRKLQKEFSYMFQDNALFDFLSVYDNIALPLTETPGKSSSEIMEKVNTRMELLGLGPHGKLFPSQLSGGMRKRVALARALVTDPKVVLFDEPTTGLDPVRKKRVHAMIAEYQKHFGFTAVIVSHDIPDIFEIAQRVAMLDQGRITFQGTSRELALSDDPRVKAFINGEDESGQEVSPVMQKQQKENYEQTTY